MQKFVLNSAHYSSQPSFTRRDDQIETTMDAKAFFHHFSDVASAKTIFPSLFPPRGFYFSRGKVSPMMGRGIFPTGIRGANDRLESETGNARSWCFVGHLRGFFSRPFLLRVWRCFGRWNAVSMQTYPIDDYRSHLTRSLTNQVL